MTVPVVLIAAVGRNGAIGLRDGLPWRLPSDLRHFKVETMGKPVVMGRKTFASLGRPRPCRHFVVVSRDPAPGLPDGVVGATGIDEALASARGIAADRGAAEVMVAGGAEIYRAVLPVADALLITAGDLAPEADGFFPAINPALWRELSRTAGDRGERDEAGYAILRYGRR